MSFYPPSATIVSGDIQLRSAVLHITDLPVGLPASTSTALHVNGLNAFKAVAAAAGPQAADALDQSPAITIFVPQDSALSAIVRQLPQRQMQKLIRDVAKYKRKVNEMKKLAEKSQQQQSQSESEGEDQYDSEFEQLQPQQQLKGSQFSVSSSPALDSMRWQSQHSPLRTKLKLRGGDVDTDLQEEESGAEGGDIEGGEQQRTAALAQSIAQLQQSAPLPFDLAKWCQQNGIEIDEEAARRGEAEGEEGEGEGAERAEGLERPAGRRRLNKQQLAQFVQAHIVSGLVHSPDLAQLQSVTSVSGKKLSVQCGSASRTLMVGGANLLFTDILSKNAVIHVIDRPIGVKQQQQQTEQQSDTEFSEEEGDQQQPQQLQLGSFGRAHSVGQRGKLRLMQSGMGGKQQFGSSGEQLQALSSWSLKAFEHKSLGHSPSTLKSHSQLKVKTKMMKLRGLGGVKSRQLQQRQWKGGRLMRGLGGVQAPGRMGVGAAGLGLGQASDSSAAECMHDSSRQCRLVDSLQRNPAWQRMRDSPNKLFSASNEPNDISCKLSQSTADSRDSFAAATVSKCYKPDVYVCAQGKLVLKVRSNKTEKRGGKRKGGEWRDAGVRLRWGERGVACKRSFAASTALLHALTRLMLVPLSLLSASARLFRAL